ncbi:SigB/SigF/SigG family RNA polymerase sigma factor [Streptomyces violascens]|uniref:RNA polymerase sigma factor n=1 Tax=Streptomyces violascens TaxID=67381 RepID=A0ABQ3QEV5_9ACTN|nr:SigB/SigF/SigG family RNA polymerase sigma factor [Streptomyces violascens]GGU46720.1 RNA polymerase sigma factor [Streptomyces violascens]GHI35818.1 RNA polymerase sigma factor [Streptomyces violascens]
MPTTVPRHRTHDDAPDTTAAFTRLNSLDQGPEHDALRDDLVAQWLPMSQRVAGKYRNRGAELDDLRQVAAMGLVKAVDRYEVARGAFEAYAIPTINGELKRHFRDTLWSVHVPRRVQEIRNKVRVARSELQAAQPGEPTIAELAAQAGLEEDEVRDGLQALQSFKSLSLDAETIRGDEAGEGVSLADSLGQAEAGFDTAVDREAVKPALRALPERESKILYMRFFQDKTQNQIATELGISQMHVSRLITRTCTRIREQALAEHRDVA